MTNRLPGGRSCLSLLSLFVCWIEDVFVAEIFELVPFRLTRREQNILAHIGYAASEFLNTATDVGENIPACEPITLGDSRGVGLKDRLLGVVAWGFAIFLVQLCFGRP